ncbi:hypothetical protein [Hymenobacter ruricola]|uniref:DUF4890 domain-containing protein n=1 Tax=Hymenobacter ruricola TaxID=2791023 RepID=A0ABS0IBH2_9BACT|nr:hypothetical protein [Hymenobacter ruricola]MBF9224106.1 hypothetical protein [Hymenobacter ruricola]
MKNILFLGTVLALAPAAARAQYGPGGTESLSQHHANAAAEVEAQQRATASTGGNSGSKRIMPLIPLFRTPEEKARRSHQKAQHALKKNDRKQAKINAELSRQREAVLK